MCSATLSIVPLHARADASRTLKVYRSCESFLRLGSLGPSAPIDEAYIAAEFAFYEEEGAPLRGLVIGAGAAAAGDAGALAQGELAGVLAYNLRWGNAPICAADAASGMCRHSALSDPRAPCSGGGGSPYMAPAHVACLLSPTPRPAYISLLMVAPAHRRSGVARGAVQSVADEHSAALCGIGNAIHVCPARHLYIGVQVNNPEGQALWKALGFRAVSAPELLADGTTCVMMRR